MSVRSTHARQCWKSKPQACAVPQRVRLTRGPKAGRVQRRLGVVLFTVIVHQPDRCHERADIGRDLFGAVRAGDGVDRDHWVESVFSSEVESDAFETTVAAEEQEPAKLFAQLRVSKSGDDLVHGVEHEQTRCQAQFSMATIRGLQKLHQSRWNFTRAGGHKASDLGGRCTPATVPRRAGSERVLNTLMRSL